jgi:hypothetical protein
VIEPISSFGIDQKIEVGADGEAEPLKEGANVSSTFDSKDTSGTDQEEGVYDCIDYPDGTTEYIL